MCTCACVCSSVCTGLKFVCRTMAARGWVWEHNSLLWTQFCLQCTVSGHCRRCYHATNSRPTECLPRNISLQFRLYLYPYLHVPEINLTCTYTYTYTQVHPYIYRIEYPTPFSRTWSWNCLTCLLISFQAFLWVLFLRVHRGAFFSLLWILVLKGCSVSFTVFSHYKEQTVLFYCSVNSYAEITCCLYEDT